MLCFVETSAGRPYRRSVRLADVDGVVDATWMITICAFERQEIFGSIDGGTMSLSSIGRIVDEEWRRSAIIRPQNLFGEYAILPDHMHALSFVPANDERSASTFHHVASRSLASMIGGFKSSVTSRCRTMQGNPHLRIWQRGFHEHGVRNTRDLICCERYIRENVMNWKRDVP
jgi:putative transposase